MPRVNNVIQQVSQLNTYEQGKVFDETYFALSYKGNHSKSSNFTMPRESESVAKK